jgi:DNA polymerase-3 subunit chi
VLQVDFYILHGCVGPARNRFVCRLLEKIWQQKQAAYLYTQSETEARQLDNLLWTFRLESFIPHALWWPGQAATAPILLGHDPQHCPTVPLLLNLSANVPVFFKQFERILELVEDNEAARGRARHRYRLYRDAGHHLVTHEISC